MEPNKIAGIMSIILGLIFLVFPFIGIATVSILIGISLMLFGIVLIIAEFKAVNIIVGILAIIVGLIFISNIAALSFVLGLEFYIVGILLIFAGVAGLISTGSSKIISALMIVLGIISFALGAISFEQPIFAAVILGVALIVEGIGLFMD